MKTTQKDIKNTQAIDITYSKEAEIYAIKKTEGWLTEIAYSMGVYGVNGCVWQGHNTGKLYKMTARTSTFYYI